jgi:hypothetical protein
LNTIRTTAGVNAIDLLGIMMEISGRRLTALHSVFLDHPLEDQNVMPASPTLLSKPGSRQVFTQGIRHVILALAK